MGSKHKSIEEVSTIEDEKYDCQLTNKVVETLNVLHFVHSRRCFAYSCLSSRNKQIRSHAQQSDHESIRLSSVA